MYKYFCHLNRIIQFENSALHILQYGTVLFLVLGLLIGGSVFGILFRSQVSLLNYEIPS